MSDFHNDEVCWLDQAGKMLEDEGFLPGQIFEFHNKIHANLYAGGVVATRNLADGQPPTQRSDIARVVLRDRWTGELHIMNPDRPIWFMNAHSAGEYC